MELQFCYIIFAKFVQLNLISFLPSFVPQEHEQLSYSSTRSKAPSVIITGLKPATKYIFHIRVRTAAGYSGYSQKFEFETGDESKFYWRKKKKLNTIEVASNSKPWDIGSLNGWTHTICLSQNDHCYVIKNKPQTHSSGFTTAHGNVSPMLQLKECSLP